MCQSIMLALTSTEQLSLCARQSSATPDESVSCVAQHDCNVVRLYWMCVCICLCMSLHMYVSMCVCVCIFHTRGTKLLTLCHTGPSRTATPDPPKPQIECI